MGSTSAQAASAGAKEKLAALAMALQPTALAREKTLPASEAFRPMLPAGGVVLGSMLRVAGSGATSMALSLFAEASRQGAWVAIVGIESIGWAAMAHFGVSLERTVAVDEPPAGQWREVMASLIDSFDVVIFEPVVAVKERDARRLAARVRERETVLVQLESPTARRRYRYPVTADETITAETKEWLGLEEGYGHLSNRSVSVSVGSRGTVTEWELENFTTLVERDWTETGSEGRHLKAV